MTEGIIIALITGGVSALVSIIGIVRANNVHDAIIDEKIGELTREVRRHNEFAERLPRAEADIKVIKTEVDNISKRVDRLEV